MCVCMLMSLCVSVFMCCRMKGRCCSGLRYVCVCVCVCVLGYCGTGPGALSSGRVVTTLPSAIITVSAVPVAHTHTHAHTHKYTKHSTNTQKLFMQSLPRLTHTPWDVHMQSLLANTHTHTHKHTHTHTQTHTHRPFSIHSLLVFSPLPVSVSISLCLHVPLSHSTPSYNDLDKHLM